MKSTFGRSRFASFTARTITMILLHIVINTSSALGATPIHNKVHTPKLSTSVRRANGDKKLSVLALTETAGFRHSSIKAATKMLEKYASTENWKLQFSNDLAKPLRMGTSLQTYDVIVFLITTGDIFSKAQKVAFEQYVTHGGAVVMLHSGMTAMKDWEFFASLSAARFRGHATSQDARFVVRQPSHPSVRGLPRSWIIREEIYNFREPIPFNDMKVILAVDTKSFTGGLHSGVHPVTWTRAHGRAGSRIWVSTLGHVGTSFYGKFDEALFVQRHIVEGITWAARGTAEARKRWLEAN